MAQSFAQVWLHIIFSTKGRRNYLTDEVRDDVHSYTAAVLKDLGSPVIRVGRTADHMHILSSLPRTTSIAKLIEQVKVRTSPWIKTKNTALSDFAWQHGYGVFSVSQSDLARVTDYIVKQEEHHRTLSFQDEFRKFLDPYEIEYDERYVWD